MKTKKIKPQLQKMAKVMTVVALTFAISSCSDEEQLPEGDTSSITEDFNVDSINEEQTTRATGDSPWEFDSSYSTNDYFQADDDGRGAHNWDEDDYNTVPDRNNIVITDYIYVEGDRLILQCPNGNGVRRAEYRDITNIDIDKRNRMDLTFDIRDYNNSSELIMAQLHNDNTNARRPYATVIAEDGEIRLQRTNAPTGSSSTTASERIPFRQNDRYRIRMETPNGSRNLDVRINNLDTGEEARNTFSFDSDWSSLDGNFYWKHGAYMPDGGSNNTRMRVETISFATNRTD